MLRVLIRFSAVAFLCLSLPVAWGQYGSSIQGVVTDQTGAAVTGAKVSATNESTGVARDTVCDNTGFYRISALAPGSYTVRVEAPSFQIKSTVNVAVQAELARGLDIALQPGQAKEAVTVNGSAPALETEDANLTGELTSMQVERLPALDRDPYELLRLSPGIFGDGERYGDGRSVGFPNGPGANNGSGGPGGSNSAIFQVENQQSISANGQRITSNDYLVDGVSVNSLQWGGAAVITPSIESVQEITVLSNDYDASDGRSSGAHIKTITKSGSNSYHGGGVFQYHTPGLNAYNKFNGYNPGVGFTPTVRDTDVFREFAGTLGGAVVKDKVFFFFNYEGGRENITTFQDEWVDTPQLDQLMAADRPGTPIATILQSPGSTPRIRQVLPTTCALWIAANQPCAVVAGGINIGSPGESYGTYNPSFTGGNPAEYAGGGLTNIPELAFAEVNLPQTVRGDQYNARVDYNRGKDQFAVNTFITFLDTLGADAGAQGRAMADIKSNNFSPSGFLSWIRTINSSTLNEARFNFTRYAYNGISDNPQVNWEIPRIEIQGLPLPGGARIRYGAAQGDTTPAIAAQNTFAFRDVLTKIIGANSFKFGFEFDREEDNDELIGGARPDQVFQGFWNFANGTPIFEQVEVNPLTGGAPTTRPRYFRSGDYGVFVQDDWKFRPNLTLNLGLRWEYYAPPTEADGHLANFEPTSNPVTGLLNGSATNPSQMWNPTWRNFGPRLGFAWSPTRFHDKTVVRGGFGMAYDRLDDVTFNNARNNPPYVANYGICCGTAPGEFGTPFVNGQIAFSLGTTNSPNGYPANPVLITPINPTNGLPTILPGQGAPNIWSNPTYMPVPYSYLYSMQIQHMLPKDWVATIGYQGSATHHLTRIKNLQYFYPQNNPDVNSIFTPTPDTNASFNALNTQMEHKFGHGVSANLLYTYSKSIDQVSAEGPGFVTNQTYPIDDATERGPSDYDATHYVRAYGDWNLPIFPDRHDLLGSLLGGFRLDGVFEFHSGFPWTPVASNLCPVLGATSLCPLRPIAYDGGAKNNYDTDAFLPPRSANFPALAGLTAANPSNPYFTLQTTGSTPAFPGIGRNSFRGPRYQDIDLGIAKHFALPQTNFLGENAGIEVRMNLYNAFNKLNLAPFTFGSTSTTISSFNNSSGQPVANPLFGTATTGLAGRIVELQGRFSF
jgi:Carboxypeptidase regulatory-like domain/TonB dependent receptor